MIGFDIGGPEMIIVLVIVLVLFGGSQLPKLAANLGKAQKEFKDGMDDGAKAAGSPTVVSPTSVTDTTATSSKPTPTPPII